MSFKKVFLESGNLRVYEWESFFETSSVSKKLSRYLIFRHINLWYLFFYHWYLDARLKLHLIKSNDYYHKYWKFLALIEVSDSDLEKFISTVKLKHMQFLVKPTVKHTVIGYNTPEFLLSSLLPDLKNVSLIGLPITKEGNWSGSDHHIEESLNTLKSSDDIKDADIYGNHKFIKSFKKYSNRTHLFIYGSRFENNKCYFLYELFQAIIVVIISGITAVVTNLIAGYTYSPQMALDVVKTLSTFKMNFLPVVLVGLFIYFLSGRIWLSSGLNFLIFGALAFGNHYKLLFRDDAVTFSDLGLLAEASNMSKRYVITINWKHIVLIFLLVVALIVLVKLFKKISFGYFRLIGIVLITLFAFTYGKQLMSDNKVYASIGPVKYGNIWKATNQYMSKGFTYAFSHSMFNTGVEKPEGYTDAKAKKLLSKYKKEDIPENKKVNVIMIMMEAFNDFSKYPQLSIDPSVYSGLKQVESESVYGRLDTNIFAAGTIDTERKTVTGYSQLQNFNTKTDSFAWYFKNQGYNTQALHPGYGWFYNRKNVDPLLGLDNFKYMENYYKKYNQFVVPDADFFETIHKNTINSKKPYFNLSVTYQNHGPYKDTFSGTPLLGWKDGYNQKDYAIVNNYLTGIKNTSDEILKLTQSFENDKPTVIMFYGDHNPWLGEGNSAYNMMHIDLNLSTRQGYENYYQTPYVMWANKKAKKALGNQFVGKGPNFSPMFLLPEYLKRAGISGDQYMQYLQDLQPQISVFGQEKYIINNKFVSEPTGKYKKIYNDFKTVEYYRMKREN